MFLKLKDREHVSTCIQQTRGRRQNPTNPREVDILDHWLHCEVYPSLMQTEQTVQ